MPSSADITSVERIDSGLNLVDALQHAMTAHGELPAVVDADNVTSFRDLYTMACRISAALDTSLASSSHVIGLISPPTALAIAAILGIIFSGRAYLPIDFRTPDVQRSQIVADAQADLVLNDEEIKKYLGVESSIVSPKKVEPNHLAAILYTSGTTGKAKGVLHSHRCVLFHALTYIQHMEIKPVDRVSLFPALHVGASISNVFAAMLAGATVYPISIRQLDLKGIVQFIGNHGLTVLHMVPSLFRRLIQVPNASAAFARVHHLKLGGEPISSRDVRLFRQLNLPGAHLMNGLGITEAGGNVTFGKIPLDISGEALVPIGRIVDGITADILPAEYSAGDVGELVVRSRYLASGYVGDTGSTTFTIHDDGLISLRTGDMVKRDADGTWRHLGRMDQIVKINGHRVSLPEVETALRSLPGVHDAAAIAEFDLDKTPVLCGVLAGTDLPSLSTLREYMKAHVMLAMIPARFYQVESLPYGTGGKINRNALSEIMSAQIPLRDAPPRNPTGSLEVHLLAIWQRVLRLPDIGVDDLFFSVGGDSLKAADLLTAIHRQLNFHLSIEQLYRYDSVAKLATMISSGNWRECDHPAAILREGNRNQTVFLIPGAGSDVVALWDLAHALPASMHVVGLQYPGLDGKSPYLKTVPEMAEYFLRHICKHQTTGPYCLIGTSFGGMVAFEMTRQLEAKGECVSFLGLIDTYAPHYLSFRRDLPMAGKIKAIKYWSLPIGQKREWTFPQAIKGLREKYFLIKARISLNFPVKILRPYKHRFYFLMELCFNAGQRYVIQPVKTPMTVFRVEQQLPPELFDQNDWLGWKNASTSGVKSIPIPGVHGAHIRPPYVFQLAAIIAREINS